MTRTPDAIRYPHEEPPEPGGWREVAEGILWIRLPLPMALDHVNVYALRDEDGWTLFDTGFDTRKTRAMWATLLAGPLAGAPVARVIASHHHPDHIGLAGWFQSEHGAETVTTRTAWLMTRMLTLDHQDVTTPETLAHWRAAGMPEEMMAARTREKPFNFADCVAPLPMGYTRIAEGGTIRAGGRTWDIRIGNGHAPEHATMWSRDDNLVLTGDQIIPSISPNLGVFASEPDANPVADWLTSCSALAPHARADQLALPGHKLPFTGIPLRLRQLIENHHGALERLFDYLDAPRTAADCFLPLFKRQVGGGEYGLALIEAFAHLNHLHQADRITRVRSDAGAWLWQKKAGGE